MMTGGDLKMYTLRHFLFYMGVAATAGAVIGTLSGLMDWSIGLTYLAGLSSGTAIVLAAMRKGLFGPSRRSDGRRHHRHA